MVAIYAQLIIKGKKTIEDVPNKIREAVRVYLKEHYDVEV